ncbi:MAG TPA: ArsA family ATPase [Acidimicrobiales bacterium]|jgi:anion-transporting  ArsA/GET3 family ATPase|nr:ArsA family ATPase [Acidimicrobiales bacterium]
MVDVLERRLLFVTGKGGVGKSTTAAALALLGAARGTRTLAVEVDAKGDLADFFETPRPGFEPKKVAPNLWAMAMDTEASLREYLHLQLRLPTVARLGPIARAFDFVATAAPGVREILTVGKIGWEVRERHYDLVVVDAAATGHIVGQLGAPEAINQLVRVGQVRQQTGWLTDLLADPATTGLVIVTTPEEMPVNETIELVRRIESDTRVDVAAIVVNQVLPELFSGADEEVFERLREPVLSERLAEAAGGPVSAVLEAARLAVTLRRTRAGHLDHLRASIDPSIPLLYVPYLFARGHGLRTTGQVAAALSEELGY